MSNCPSDEVLEKLLQDDAEERTDDEIQRHVKACSQCQEKLRRLAGNSAPRDLISPTVAFEGDASPAQAAGAVLAGRYRLIEVIGEGGMGVVWAADQLEPVRRKVAIKVIKAGMDTKAVLQRFEAERQALAMMDHPNIARVLDGGMTEERRPFFVMEMVQGQPLNGYCDSAKLSIRARLELFAIICQAVQHAHQKGIIHRDLKPSNILIATVDGRPVPKVIDFGVAKAVGDKLTDDALTTQFGSVVGTLEYMSPEQAGLSSTDIDTRSDIYSLGVILYELLTGLRPIDAVRLRKAALTEMIRMIQEDEPSKPSTRLSSHEAMPSLAAVRQMEPRQLVTLLRGELDWVVLKCLEKHRERRYETANGLARDIHRYLADEPVEAKPPSAGYLLNKFIRRNRVPVMAVSFVLLALIAGIVSTSWALVRAVAAEGLANDRLADVKKAKQETDEALIKSESQRVRAEGAEKQAKAVADYLVDAFRRADPFVDGRDLKVVDLLDKALAKLNSDETMEDLIKSRLKSTLGLTYHGLGLNDVAIKLFEQSRSIYELKLGVDHPDALKTNFWLMVILGEINRLTEAQKLGVQLLARQTKVLGEDHPETLVTMGQLANVYRTSDMLAEAITLAEKSVAKLRRKTTDEKNELPNSMTNLATMYRQAGRTAQAIKLHEEAYEMRKLTQAADHPDMITAMSLLCLAYRDAGRLNDSIELQKTSLSQIEKKLGQTHTTTLSQANDLIQTYVYAHRLPEAVALSETMLQRVKNDANVPTQFVLYALRFRADVHSAMNQSKESIALLRETVDVSTKRLGIAHPDSLTYLHQLGVAYKLADQPEQAVPYFEKALAGLKTIADESNPKLLITQTQLASTYLSLGRTKDAIELLEQILVVQKKKFDPDHRDLLVTMNALASGYESAGRFDDAVGLQENVVARFTKKFGPKSKDVRMVTSNLGKMYLKANRIDDSERTYQQLVLLTRDAKPVDKDELATNLLRLSETLLVAKKYDAAGKPLHEAHELLEKSKPDSWTLFLAKSLIGESLVGKGKFAEAEPHLNAGYAGMKKRQTKISPRSNVFRTTALERLIRLYESSNKKDSADKWRKELQSIKSTPTK